MTTAKELLALIEAVDPADESGLDEIDARVFMYLEHGSGEQEWVRDFSKNPWSGAKYSRSRDALKAIRANGWYSSAKPTDYRGGIAYWREAKKLDTTKRTDSPHMPTEELAELYAIIKAIAYERGEG